MPLKLKIYSFKTIIKTFQTSDVHCDAYYETVKIIIYVRVEFEISVYAIPINMLYVLFHVHVFLWMCT